MPEARHLTVLLLHGLCSTSDELLPVHTALRSAGHDVRPLAIPGYTYDTRQDRQLAAPRGTWVRAVCHHADQAHSQGQRVVLVGLSAGAVLALAATMHNPSRIAGVVLLSTPLQYDGWSVPRRHVFLPLALYTPLGRFWKYREHPPYGVKNERVRSWIEHELATRKVSRAGAAVISVAHLREFDRLRRSVRARLGSFDCPPVLALHAREDELASLSNLRLLQARLKPRSMRSVELDDCYHMITMDNERRRVVAETLEFVRSLAHPSDA